jgi:hypothetical protein
VSDVLNTNVSGSGPCGTFLNPGPPYYAAQCLLPRGHDGEHKFPSKEECQAMWRETWPPEVRRAYDQRV